MAATTSKNSAEEVIEKKDTSPVAMACLVIAMVAIIAAIALQVREIADYRTNLAFADREDPVKEILRQDTKKLQDEVKKIIEENPGSTFGTEGGAAPTGEGGAGTRAAPPAEPEAPGTPPPAANGKKKPEAKAPGAPSETEEPATKTEEPAAETTEPVEASTAEGGSEEPIFNTGTEEETKEEPKK